MLFDWNRNGVSRRRPDGYPLSLPVDCWCVVIGAFVARGSILTLKGVLLTARQRWLCRLLCRLECSIAVRRCIQTCFRRDMAELIGLVWSGA